MYTYAVYKLWKWDYSDLIAVMHVHAVRFAPFFVKYFYIARCQIDKVFPDLDTSSGVCRSQAFGNLILL